MIVLRILGWILLLAAVFVAGMTIFVAFSGGDFSVRSSGQIWFAIDPASLNGLQAGVQRNIHPLLWDPFLLFILDQPSWVLFAFLGFLGPLCIRLGRPRD